MITLLNFFTFAEADGGSGFYTPWVPIPADIQVGEYWIDCKTFHTGQLDITLESSPDGDATQVVDGPTSIAASGLTRTEITDKLAPMVRLFLQESGGAGGTIMCISVWIIPKQGG